MEVKFMIVGDHLSFICDLTLVFVWNNLFTGFLVLLPDDNEFEEVDIVRPNDFYQARDADAGNW